MDSIGIVIYKDYLEYLSYLSPEEKGRVMEALLEYAFNEKEPSISDKTAKLAFAFMKNQLDRDREKYEKKCETNRKNGAFGGRPPKDGSASKNEAASEKDRPSAADKASKASPVCEAPSVQAAPYAPFEPSAPSEASSPAAPAPCAVPVPEKRDPFDEFWEEYPKKTDRTAAECEFRRLAADPATVSAIMSALRKQKSTDEWQRENGRFVPRASAWLIKKDWENLPQGNGSQWDSYNVNDFF